MVGPIALGTSHPILAQMLSISQPGQLWPPTRIGEWLIIVRLEKLIPAQLDEPMRQQLLNHLFDAWLCEQLNQTDWEVGRTENTEIGIFRDVNKHPFTPTRCTHAALTPHSLTGKSQLEIFVSQ